MVLTIQHRIILNTFNRQSTKAKLDNILCASNFRLHMFSNFEATIQIFVRLIFVYRGFFCLQFTVGNKPLSLLLRTLNAFFVIAGFCLVFVLFCFLLYCVFFFFCYWVKLKICGSEFHQFYFLGKPQDCYFLQNCSFNFYIR